MAAGVERLIDQGLIKVLLTIEETKSFGGAAQVLGVTQPSISQQVKRIEHYVGRRLFHRTRRGAVLTADGEAVIVYARAVLVLTDDLRRHFDITSYTEEVAIGMSEDFCRTALPSVLWLFTLEHPNVRVRVVSGTYGVLTNAIEEKAIDFAIIRRYDRFPEARLLWRSELTWNGRYGMALPIDDPVPLVLPLPPNPARDTPIRHLRESGRPYVVRFESVGLAGIEAALQAGLGVCAGPRCMRLYGAGPLKEGHGLPKLPDVEFVLVVAKTTINPLANVFVSLLTSAAEASFAESRTLPETASDK